MTLPLPLRTPSLTLALWLAAACCASAVVPLDFAKDILPILERNCLPCHNATKSEGGLNIETPQLMLKGGENGPVIKPNHAQESMLYRTAARLEKPFMPPAENKSKAQPLTSLQLEILRRWIDEGATGHGKAREAPKWQTAPARIASVSAVAVNPQGTVAAAARGRQVTLYDLVLRQPLLDLPENAHPDVVSSLAFSPDGERLATGSFGEVKVWQRQPPEIVPTTAKISAANEVQARSDDGRLLASAPAGAVARITTADEKTVVAELRTDVRQNQALSELALNLSAAEYELEFQKQEQHKAEQQQKAFEEEDRRASSEHSDFQKRRDAIEKSIAAAQQKQADLKKALDAAMMAQVDATAAKKQAERQENESMTAARKADQIKDKAAVADKPAAEKAWQDAQNIAARATQDREQTVKALVAADKKLAQATTDHNEATKVLIEARSETGKAVDAERTAHKAAEDVKTGKAALAAAILQVASAQTARDAAAKSKTEAEKTLPPCPSAFRGLAFDHYAGHMLSIHDDGCIRAWSATSGRALWTQQVSPQPLGSIVWREGKWLFSKADGSTYSLSHEPRWTLLYTLGNAASPDSPLTDRVNALAFSPDGKLLATGSGDPSRSGEIKIWESATGRLVRDIDRPHKDAVISLAFSADGTQLASGAADHAVRLWEAASGRQLRNLEAHSNHVLAVAFRHDGRRLATAGADNAIRTWNLQTGDVIKTISDFKREVTGLAYIENRNLLVASTGDPELRLLNDEGATVRSSKDATKSFITSMAAATDGKTAVVGTASGEVLMLNGEGKEVAAFPVDASPRQPQ